MVRISNVKVDFPTAPEDAETSSEISSRKHISRGQVYKLLDRLAAQGYTIHCAKVYRKNRTGGESSIPAWWATKK